MYGKYHESEILLGKTITALTHADGERIDITLSDGKRFAFLHNQDCCESVAVHDITGDLFAIIGSPLTVARKEISEDWPADVPAKDTESFTWTMLTLETAAAKVRVRWLGESNGYYGEGIDLEEIES